MAKWFLLELPGDDAQPIPLQHGVPLLVVGSVTSTDARPELTRRWLQAHGVDLRWAAFVRSTSPSGRPLGGCFERCLFPESVALSLLELQLKDEAPVTVTLGYSVAGVLLLGTSSGVAASPPLFTREELLTPATPERVTQILLRWRLLLARSPSSGGTSAVAEMR